MVFCRKIPGVIEEGSRWIKNQRNGSRVFREKRIHGVASKSRQTGFSVTWNQRKPLSEKPCQFNWSMQHQLIGCSDNTSCRELIFPSCVDFPGCGMALLFCFPGNECSLVIISAGGSLLCVRRYAEVNSFDNSSAFGPSSMNRRSDAAFARFSNSIAVSAAEAPTIEESLRFVVQQICDYVPWAFGRARVAAHRILNREIDVWHFGLSPRSESRDQSILSKLTAASKAWHSRTPITGRSFVVDLEKESDLSRQGAAHDLGLRSALVAPIVLRRQVIGALEFYSEKLIRVGELFLEILSDLAAKMGYIIELKATEDNARRLSEQLLRAQDEERRRLAKELHDTTVQNVAMMIMDLGVVSQRSDALDPNARTALSDCVSLAQQSMRELRTLSYQLHPPMLDELGLLPALRIYAEGFSKRSGMQVQTELPNTYPQLPKELETAVFHVVQEGLTNAQRHSASPWAKIGLSVSPAGLRISVENVATATPQLTNDGATLGTAGVGMRSMQERVQHFRGHLALRSDQNRTILEVVFPLSPSGNGTST
jgi:signal transduction histidine kinase